MQSNRHVGDIVTHNSINTNCRCVIFLSITGRRRGDTMLQSCIEIYVENNSRSRNTGQCKEGEDREDENRPERQSSTKRDEASVSSRSTLPHENNRRTQSPSSTLHSSIDCNNQQHHFVSRHAGSTTSHTSHRE